MADNGKRGRWDWEIDLRREKEKDFFSWLEIWYKEHIKRPRKIESKIEWYCAFHMKPKYEVRDLEDTRNIFIRIDRVHVQIVPYTDQDLNSTTLLNESVLPLEQDKFENVLSQISNIYYDCQNEPPYDYDLHEAQTVLIDAQENERLKISAPGYTSYYEESLCHLVVMHIIYNDWINRDGPNKYMLDMCESKFFPPTGMLRLEELLNLVVPENDLGFNGLDNMVKSLNYEKIERFDLLPPKWFKYIPILKESNSSNVKLEPSSGLKGREETSIASQPDFNKPDSTFIYSSDYTSIVYHGRQIMLTSYQAEAVKLLHEAHKKGLPGLHQDAIIVEIDSTSKRLRDVFKSSLEEVWDKLIVSVPVKKGFFRLNL